MDKSIIAMRHGKAEKPTGARDDIDRSLSEAGARALKATLGNALGIWPDEGGLPEIWTSPAARARQTADLLAQALRKRGIAVDDPKADERLWTGDLASLLDDIRASSAETVVLVGHNPFTEELVEALTGSRVRFATGALAAIGLHTAGPAAAEGEPEGRLLWFAQGPVSQRWKTLASMEATLAGAMDSVMERYHAFLDNPDDIETLHALRVSIRTARSLTAFVKPWQSSRQNAQVQDDLRSVVRLTSRQRELDVMCSQVNSDGSLSAELEDFCETQAAAERAHVIEALCEKRVRNRLARAHASMGKVRWKRRLADKGLGAEEVRARFDQMVERLVADTGSLDLAQAERTHDIRKKAKRVRYSAERFKAILGDDAIAVSKEMVKHQDGLGAICDARASIDIINGMLAADLPDHIQWELSLLRAGYETFLYGALRDARDKAAGKGEEPHASNGSGETEAL